MLPAERQSGCRTTTSPSTPPEFRERPRRSGTTGFIPPSALLRHQPAVPRPTSVSNKSLRDAPSRLLLPPARKERRGGFFLQKPGKQNQTQNTFPNRARQLQKTNSTPEPRHPRHHNKK